MVVVRQFKIQTFKDLIAEFKANPGSVSWGGGSAGGSDHIMAGLIAEAIGVDPAKTNYIAYAGGGKRKHDHGWSCHRRHQRIRRVSGTDQVGQAARPGGLLGSAHSGEEIPTLKEQGVDIDLVNWRAVFAAPGISDAQKKDLLDAVEKATKSKSWQEALKRNDWTDMYLGGDQFKTFLDAEQIRIAKIMDGLHMGKK